MSPSSSHPISLTEYETTETTIDAECLTTSTAGEPNGHIIDECDLKNSKKCKSCKRCGSIGSNKSEIVTIQRNTEFNYDDQSPTLIRHKCCASSSRIDAIVDLDDCPITITSRRPSMCSLRHGISTTSLNCRSSMRSICSKHGKEHSMRHQKRSQSHHRHERCNSRQHSHQHIANGGSSPHMSRNCCRHRRRISCSSHSGESIHYRKRIDSETSSFYGSESSIYEPNHTDGGGGGGASSTNTVVLTPTKITIEHKEDTHLVEEYSNGITSVNRNKYVASPTHWNFLTEDYDDDRHINNGKLNSSDAVQYDDYHRGGNEKKGALRKHYHRKSTPTHTRQRSDPDMSNDSIGTIIFHHKGESSGNCCEAYYQCNNNEIEMEQQQPQQPCNLEIDNDFVNKKIDSNESILNNVNSCDAQPSQLNFHKNNISSMLEKPLNLLPDLRRYSKITNLQSQNATNLTPNYFQNPSEPSTSNQTMANNKFNNHNRIGMTISNSHNNQLLTQTTTTTTTTSMLSNYTTVSSNEFELVDLTTPSAFQKPFGSISLTAQNDFEPYSHIRNRARSNASDQRHIAVDGLTSNSISLDHLDRITFSESNERVNYRMTTSSESLVTMTDVRDGISINVNQQSRRFSRLINIIRKRARNYIKKN